MRTNLILVLLLTASFALAQVKKQPDSKEKKKVTDKERSGFFSSHSPRARDFHSVGHSIFFDLNLSPITFYSPEKGSEDTVIKYSRLTSYSFYHISYYFRYNVIQADDDNAVTFTFNPGVGLGVSQANRLKGFGSFSGAALAGYEWGCGATYRSESEKGGFIRIGAEYIYTPLLVTSRSRDEHEIRSWISPVLSFGFRSENQKQNLIETNFKVGLGTEKVKEEGNSVSPYTIARPFTFRFSFVVFLDH